MNAPQATLMDLTDIGPGFADPVHAAQQVFRVALDALAHPGRVFEVATDTAPPVGVGSAANALLMALLDQDTSLHVSPLLGDAVAHHLRFHTGCRMAATLAEADFVLLAVSDAWPGAAAFAIGSEYSPEHAATVVREVSSLADGLPLALTGPGIATTQALRASGLNAAFVADWQAMRKRFPCGVDLFLTCGSQVAGLPRSIRISTEAEATCT